jgi:hypothetical protein
MDDKRDDRQQQAEAAEQIPFAFIWSNVKPVPFISLLARLASELCLFEEKERLRIIV